MSIGLCGGYIVKTGSLIVLQEYEVDRSSGGVQENLRNRLGHSFSNCGTRTTSGTSQR